MFKNFLMILGASFPSDIRIKPTVLFLEMPKHNYIDLTQHRWGSIVIFQEFLSY